MIILLFASLLGAWAVPISTGPITTPTIAHTLVWGIDARDAGCGMTERKMLSIVRSCLLTIAACVYRAIHQNIPDPKAGWWRRQGVRAKITFYALLTPEMVIWWAMRQWLGAKEVANAVNAINPDLKWTRTHGYFAQMGGFGRLDTERVLYPPTLIQLLKTGKIDVKELGRVTREKINDSSKGDILSKGIVALQTTWFVFECLARLHQGLPLLELEVVTLAFAVLNTLTYGFWWHKPLDVLCPTYLHILPDLDEPNTSTPPLEVAVPQTTAETSPLLDDSAVLDDAVVEKGKGDVQNGVPSTAVARGFEKVWRVVIDGFFGGIRTIAETTRNVLESLWRGICAVGREMKDDALGTIWERLVEKPFLAVMSPLGDLFSDDVVDDDATHVSTFYAMEMSKGKVVVVGFLSCVIGMIFGAIHFLSWRSVDFPSHTQLLLWRISSVVLVTEPFCLTLFGGFAKVLDDSSSDLEQNALVSCLGVFFLLIIGILGPIFYILSRFTLLVLAFLTLRHPPPEVFQTVSWTTYIPHL